MAKFVAFLKKYWIPTLLVLLALSGLLFYYKDTLIIQNIFYFLKNYWFVPLLIVFVGIILTMMIKHNAAIAKEKALEEARHTPLSIEDKSILSTFKSLLLQQGPNWEIKLTDREFPSDEIMLEGTIEAIPIKILSYTEYLDDGSHQIKTIVTIPCDHSIQLDVKIDTESFVTNKKWGENPDINTGDPEFDNKFIVQSSKEHFPLLLLDDELKSKIQEKEGFLGSLLNIKKDTLYYAEYTDGTSYNHNSLKHIVETGIAYARHLEKYGKPENAHQNYFDFGSNNNNKTS